MKDKTTPTFQSAQYILHCFLYLSYPGGRQLKTKKAKKKKKKKESTWNGEHDTEKSIILKNAHFLQNYKPFTIKSLQPATDALIHADTRRIEWESVHQVLGLHGIWFISIFIFSNYFSRTRSLSIIMLFLESIVTSFTGSPLCFPSMLLLHAVTDLA